MKALEKPRRIKDEAVLDFMRSKMCVGLYLFINSGVADVHYKTCAFTKTGRSEANHIRRGVQTGMRTKPNDTRTLPFCTPLHQEYTTLGHQRFCEKYHVTLEAFEEEMARLNAEFRRLHPTPRNVAMKPKQRSHLHVVNCTACGNTHNIPVKKLDRKRMPWKFQCTFKNEWIEVA